LGTVGGIDTVRFSMITQCQFTGAKRAGTPQTLSCDALLTVFRVSPRGHHDQNLPYRVGWLVRPSRLEKKILYSFFLFNFGAFFEPDRA
jgi:hypothetical protein